jgi:S1-C subfamily serine protease
MQNLSEAVVLVRTFSSSAKKEEKIYNSAIKSREKKHHYDKGVTNGVCITPSGVILTHSDAICNSTKIVVSINSEYRPYSPGTNFEMTPDDYPATVTHIFPKEKLALLKINSQKKFKYIPLAKTSEITLKPNKIHRQLFGIIGKAKGERFVIPQYPYNKTNNFYVYYSYIQSVTARQYDGITYIIPTDLNMTSAFIPETHGGACINRDGSLVGIVDSQPPPVQKYPLTHIIALQIRNLKILVFPTNNEGKKRPNQQ